MTANTPTSAEAANLAPTANLDSPLVSVVIPVYNEIDNVSELVRRVSEAMHLSPWRWELLVIDDGSRDGTDRKLRQLARETPELRALLLQRNYGQSTALQAGFDAARGDYIVTLDGDLQNDPADIVSVVSILVDGNEFDMVSGWRRDRQDKWLSRKLPSRMANALIARITGVALHDNGCALKAYRGWVIRDLRLYGEQHRFIPALAAHAGARITEREVTHHARQHGSSKYGIDRTFRVIVDLFWIRFMMRFLQRPIHAFGSIGLAFAFPGMLALLWLAVDKVFMGANIGGRPLLILGALLVLVGAQFIGVGVIGEVLTRIYHEPEGRRQYRLRDLAE